MAAHRFRELLQQTHSPRWIATSADSAFVPCPVFGIMPCSQQSQVLEIYRIAAERTREQLQSRKSRIPEFSLN